MERFNFKLMMSLAVAAIVLAAACGEKETESNVSVSNISYTSCKSHTDKATKADPMWGDPDSVSVTYANGTVFITHYNLLVNCGFELNGILVDININGSTITIDEHDNPDGPQANCMCSTDNSFRLENIPHGTYTLVFNNWYPAPNSLTYTF